MATTLRPLRILLVLQLWCACADNRDVSRAQRLDPTQLSPLDGGGAMAPGATEPRTRDAATDVDAPSDAVVHTRDLPKPVRIMPLGDSLTFGTSAGLADLKGGYRIHLFDLLVAAGYDIDYVGSARNGPAGFDGDHTSMEGAGIAAIEQLWRAADPALSPHVVVLMAGTNDALGVTADQPPESAARALGALIDRIATERPGAQIVVGKLLPLVPRGFLGLVREDNAARVPKYNALVEQLVAQKRASGQKVHLADLSAIHGDALGDGIHPSAMETYDDMAELWFPAVSRAIEALRE